MYNRGPFKCPKCKTYALLVSLEQHGQVLEEVWLCSEVYEGCNSTFPLRSYTVYDKLIRILPQE